MHDFMLLGDSIWARLGLGALVLTVILGLRFVLHFVDKDRIRKSARGKRWTKVRVMWTPFGPGWFFERGERIYRVDFHDEKGAARSRYCKVGLFTGVFWRD